jgi:hypothetical protein
MAVCWAGSGSRLRTAVNAIRVLLAAGTGEGSAEIIGVQVVAPQAAVNDALRAVGESFPPEANVAVGASAPYPALVSALMRANATRRALLWISPDMVTLAEPWTYLRTAHPQRAAMLFSVAAGGQVSLALAAMLWVPEAAIDGILRMLEAQQQFTASAAAATLSMPRSSLLGGSAAAAEVSFSDVASFMVTAQNSGSAVPAPVPLFSPTLAASRIGSAAASSLFASSAAALRSARVSAAVTTSLSARRAASRRGPVYTLPPPSPSLLIDPLDRGLFPVVFGADPALIQRAIMFEDRGNVFLNGPNGPGEELLWGGLQNPAPVITEPWRPPSPDEGKEDPDPPPNPAQRPDRSQWAMGEGFIVGGGWSSVMPPTRM